MATRRNVEEDPDFELNLGDTTLKEANINLDLYDTNLWEEVDGLKVLNLTVEKPPPSKSIHYVPENVETPFKESFFWPSYSEDSRNKVKKQIPSVIISSESYINYKQKKENEKKEKIQKSVERIEKRKLKSIEKSVKRVKTQSKTKNKITKSATTTKNDLYKLGKYVIVRYEEEYSPGIIEAIQSETVSVKVMTMSGSYWKWPERDYLFNYPFCDLIDVIEEPTLINARGIYSVEEINQYKKI